MMTFKNCKINVVVVLKIKKKSKSKSLCSVLEVFTQAFKIINLFLQVNFLDHILLSLWCPKQQPPPGVQHALASPGNSFRCHLCYMQHFFIWLCFLTLQCSTTLHMCCQIGEDVFSEVAACSALEPPH